MEIILILFTEGLVNMQEYLITFRMITVSNFLFKESKVPMGMDLKDSWLNREQEFNLCLKEKLAS
jgi:hypothetical protein